MSIDVGKWIARALLPVGLIGLAIWRWAPELFCKPKAVSENMVVGCFEFWLNRYQTLISGIFALVAAWVVWMQISDERIRHREANDRRRRAATVALPEALSGLSDYTKQATQYLYGKRSDVPLPPTQAILDIRAAVEFLDGRPAVRAGEILNNLQIFRARLQGHVVKIGIGREDRMYDCALLQAYINSMFEYSRGRSENVPEYPDTYEWLINALNNCSGMPVDEIGYEEFERVRALIEQRHPISK